MSWLEEGAFYLRQESLLVGELGDGLSRRSSEGKLGLGLPEEVDLADCVRNVALFLLVLFTHS